jgi:nucleoside-diphosphate-sugar epimerase
MAAADAGKPRVLVLGGCGFIGRHLVTHLVEQNLAGKIRVADKVMPATAYLNPRQKAAFATVQCFFLLLFPPVPLLLQQAAAADTASFGIKVEFQQCNLAREASVSKVFSDADGEFTLVFNCAAITKYGQENVVYEENILGISVTCAREAARRRVQRFVELSTSQIYAADKKPSAEDSKVGDGAWRGFQRTGKPTLLLSFLPFQKKPWTLIGEYKLRAEMELATIPELNYCIVRPAIVYGVSDMLGLSKSNQYGNTAGQVGSPRALFLCLKCRA